MSDVQTLKSYLVGLGFDVNQQQYKRFQNTLADAAKTVHRETASIAGSLFKWQAGIVGLFAGIGAAVLGTLDKVAMADQEYRLFGERMFMSTANARSLKISLDALGASIEDVAFDPELHARFLQLQKDQKTLYGGLGDGSGDLKRLRDIRFEFARFGVEVQAFEYGVATNLSKLLFGDGDVLKHLKDINNWIIAHVPELSAKFAKDLVPIMKDVWRIAKDVGEIFAVMGTDFTNLIALFSGDDSLKSSTFDFDKFASAVEKVVGWLAKMIEKVLEVEKHLPILGILGGAAAGAVVGSVIPGVGTGVGAVVGGIGGGVLDMLSRAKASGSLAGGGLDLDALAEAVGHVESGNRQTDRNGHIITSSAGALGYMQLMPQVAKNLGVNAYDEADNKRGGKMLLSQLLDHYNGDTTKALEAYNWGEGNLDKALKNGRNVPLAVQEYARNVQSYGGGSGGGSSTTHISVGDIHVMQPNASPDQIKKAVLDATQEASTKQVQRNLSQLTPVWE